MNVYFRIWHSLLNVIDLSLNGRKIILRSSLQDEFPAELRHTRNLYDILPYIFRQNKSQSRQKLFF
ncbi:hypothetical protein D3C74_307110 [compost metagenome]